MKKLLIASGNQGKIREFKKILEDLPVNFVSLSEVAPDFEVEETGKTFKENAILKAKEYSKKTGFITIADDSGLEIDALDGKPGVYSARFLKGKTQEEKNEAILDMLKDISKDERTARFICVIAVVFPDDKLRTTEGVMEGSISYKQRGDNNFGYDPIFIPHINCSHFVDSRKSCKLCAGQVPKGLGRTNAELSIREKNEISHRGKALRKAKEILKEFI